MTVDEFSIEFDLLLNQMYPGNGNNYIDEYQKSLLLTKAQEEIIKEYYTNFEKSERARRALAGIVRNGEVSFDATFNNAQESIKIADTSKLFRLPIDVKLIISEQVLEADGTRHSVKPITHDEYESQKSNPFRQPKTSQAWDRVVKLDLSYTDNGQQVIEIVYPKDIVNYKFRYIKYPVPIILNDVYPDNKFDDYYYDIRTLSSATTSELDEFVHEEILDRALVLAGELLKSMNINK